MYLMFDRYCKTLKVNSQKVHKNKYLDTIFKLKSDNQNTLPYPII